jgi:putative Holliday junction resolvase
MWDERLTTVAANRAMLEADISRSKRKQIVDKVASTYILQGYLDRISKL